MLDRSQAPSRSRGAPTQPLDRYAFRRLVRDASRALGQAGLSSPESDARALAEFVVGRPLVMIDGVGADDVARFLGLVEQRSSRVPLQHLTGRMWFRGLELVCRPGVFIVRPETEVVAGAAIEAALKAAPPSQRPAVVDLCAGSGAIAAAVAVEVPAARVVAVEIDDAAAGLARENCERLAPGRVEVVRGDATAEGSLTGLDGAVDVVVSNPPYVPAGAVEDAETEQHDPDLALYGGGVDGLAVPRAVVGRAAVLLRQGGTLVMEHDPGQGAALRGAALEAGFRSAATGQDLAGRDRYLRAVR
ncbi:peptide chain release factor N(5)-glutamine methyltransferase [Actinomyces bowdenii]|uniref:peptide chain release factor N(5)-glutamine methyltransferase n=1 Tax=Actinomyces bowdenii TaxID=131109 RepID=A0A3P1V9G6_9ACTO|nr:peptide chain release factor N(5)-glutamine methyltransferase [Actinomyces bowdenii]RRD30408.1 peptide chain release factor N(5)-glutamine methyltransferase [Actinomyces bowdenii]